MCFSYALTWLGGNPKCFLNSREKVDGEEEPTR